MSAPTAKEEGAILADSASGARPSGVDDGSLDEIHPVKIPAAISGLAGLEAGKLVPIVQPEQWDIGQSVELWLEQFADAKTLPDAAEILAAKFGPPPADKNAAARAARVEMAHRVLWAIFGDRDPGKGFGLRNAAIRDVALCWLLGVEPYDGKSIRKAAEHAGLGNHMALQRRIHALADALGLPVRDVPDEED